MPDTSQYYYSNSQNYRQYPSALNQPTQSRWLTHKSAQETVLGKSSAVRHFHLRKSAFTFDHSISIGFISGLYGGRYRSSMPAAWYVLFVLFVQQLLSATHCAAFCLFFSSPCDILYHFLLQLSRVTAILEVAIKTREKTPKSWDFGGSKPWYLLNRQKVR